MADSRQLAGIIGPTLVTVTISETINLPIWTNNIATLTYLNGCLLFIAGLSIIRAHNVWTLRWPVFVTLIGWLALLGGTFRMFAPTARQGGENAATYALIAALFAIGCVLTVQACRPAPRQLGTAPDLPG